MPKEGQALDQHNRNTKRSKEPLPEGASRGPKGTAQSTLDLALALGLARKAPPSAVRPEHVLSLQCTLGNQSVLRILGERSRWRPSSSALAVQQQGTTEPSRTGGYTEAAAKAAEAFAATELGKKIKDKATELGKDFLGSLEGKIITGTVATAAIAAIAATNAELPVQLPAIPLDAIYPGLKIKVTYEGPVLKPTGGSITFILEGAGHKPKEEGMTASEKYRAETARMAAEQAKFRESMKPPEQRAAEEAAFQEWYRRRFGLGLLDIPGLKLEPGSTAPAVQRTTVHSTTNEAGPDGRGITASPRRDVSVPRPISSGPASAIAQRVPEEATVAGETMLNAECGISTDTDQPIPAGSTIFIDYGKPVTDNTCVWAEYAGQAGYVMKEDVTLAIVTAMHQLKGWAALPAAEQAILDNMLGGETNALSVGARTYLRGIIGDLQAKTEAEQVQALQTLITGKAAIPALVNEPVTAPATKYTLEGPTDKTGYAFRGSTADAEEWVAKFEDHTQVTIVAPKAPAPGYHTHTVQEVADAASYLPKTARARINTVVLNVVQNPEDAYWAAQYSMPGFRSYMTAGAAGVVTIYPTGVAQTAQVMRGSMLHETGHTWSYQTWGSDTTTGKWLHWKTAMIQDGVSVSGYAKASIAEDVAETVRVYGSTQGSARFEEYRRIVPNRFAMLEAEYFLDSIRSLVGPLLGTP